MKLSDLTNGAVDIFRNAGDFVSDLVTPTVRLGVTGLARSGKTVFITALVRNLIEGGRLPFFAPAAEGRVLRAYLEPQPDDEVPRFSYEEHLQKLGSDPPEWPRSTRRVSQLRVTIEYEPQGMIRRALGTNMLHVDIVDYPGEWLIDLPLMEQGFAEWSREALALARHPTRARHAKAFLEFLDGLDGANGDPEQLALAGARLFTTYLAAARADDHALSIAGPGRFLMPGDLEGSPLLTFFPLEAETLPAPALEAQRYSPAASLPALLARRFSSYKSHVVRPFFRDHFVRLDRQIVLVDALSALNAGPSALRDLESALQGILRCYKPGASNWLTALVTRRIDRLLFAATKADHLHHTSHDRLEAILRMLVDKALQRASLAGAEVKVMAMAALRATREVDVHQNGDILPCIQGTPLPGERLGRQSFDGAKQVAIFPGDLPASPAKALLEGRASASPEEEEMRFIRFRPPQLALNAADGAPTALPHIRLDRALDFLIGDRLQ